MTRSELKQLTREAKGGLAGEIANIFRGLFLLGTVLVVLTLLFMALVVASPASAATLSTSAPQPECLNRDVQVDLEAVGALPWQIDAIDAITRGGLSKGPVDYIQIAPETAPTARRDEIAIGWGHFTAGRSGIQAPRPLMSDLNHYWSMMAFLYSNEAPTRLFETWEGGHRRVIEASSVCHDEFKTAAVAVSNSNPTLARQLVREHACDERALLLAYYESHPTDHRRRRVEWLLGRI